MVTPELLNLESKDQRGARLRLGVLEAGSMPWWDQHPCQRFLMESADGHGVLTISGSAGANGLGHHNADRLKPYLVLASHRQLHY